MLHLTLKVNMKMIWQQRNHLRQRSKFQIKGLRIRKSSTIRFQITLKWVNNISYRYWMSSFLMSSILTTAGMVEQKFQILIKEWNFWSRSQKFRDNFLSLILSLQKSSSHSDALKKLWLSTFDQSWAKAQFNFSSALLTAHNWDFFN